METCSAYWRTCQDREEFYDLVLVAGIVALLGAIVLSVLGGWLIHKWKTRHFRSYEVVEEGRRVVYTFNLKKLRDSATPYNKEVYKSDGSIYSSMSAGSI